MDLWTTAAVILFLYILYKEGGAYVSAAGEKIKSAFNSTNKFLTYFLIVASIFFIMGEIYAAYVFGYFPRDDAFWFPVLVLLALTVYYYMG